MSLLLQSFKLAICNDKDNRHNLLNNFYVMQSKINEYLGGRSPKTMQAIKKAISIARRGVYNFDIDLYVADFSDRDYDIVKDVVNWYTECVSNCLQVDTSEFCAKYFISVSEILILSFLDYYINNLSE